MKRDFIINWFVDNSALTREQIEADIDMNYLEKGVVDSFGFLGLIAACEEELGIEFDDDDFALDEIFTISGIIDVIENK